MADVASLTLKVDATEVDKGAKALNELSASAALATKQQENLSGSASNAATAHKNWLQNMAGVDASIKATTSSSIELSKETQRILDRYDPLGTKLRALQAEFALLRREMGDSGSAAAIKGFQGLEEEIIRTKALMEQAGGAVGEHSAKLQDFNLNTQYARRELMMLGKEALSGDFSRMPATFGALVTHSNLLAAAMTPVGAGVAAITAALAVGVVAWEHWENVAVESADKTKKSIKAALEEEGRLARLNTTAIAEERKEILKTIETYEAFAEHLRTGSDRFNWRDSSEQISKYKKSIEELKVTLANLDKAAPAAATSETTTLAGSSPAAKVREIEKQLSTLTQYWEQQKAGSEQEIDAYSKIIELQEQLNKLREDPISKLADKVFAKEEANWVKSRQAIEKEDAASSQRELKAFQKQIDDEKKAQDVANKDMQRSALEAQKIIADTDPIFKAQLAWEKLTELVDAGLITTDQAGKEYANNMASYVKEITNASEKEAKIAQRHWEQFTSNVQRNLGDVLYSGLKGGFSNIGDAFKQMTLRMMADAAAANLTHALFGNEKGGGLLGSLGGNIGSLFAKSFAGGGSTGGGARSGGIDGMGGFPAILHPNETVIDHSKGQSTGTSVTIVQTINIDSRSDQSSIMSAILRAKDMAKAEIMDSLQRGGQFAQATGRAR